MDPSLPEAAGVSTSVASRFVSETALQAAQSKREEDWKAAYQRLGEEPPKREAEEVYDGRSLWEKLQENKVSARPGAGLRRRNERSPRRLIVNCRTRSRRLLTSSSNSVSPYKLSQLNMRSGGSLTDTPLLRPAENQFRALDEEEISFLDSLVDDDNLEEIAKQKEIKAQLAAFKA